MTDQVEALRELATVTATDIAGIDAHLDAVSGIVQRVEHRWKKYSDAGGDPRLQHQHFGELWMRFDGELARIVVARLEHLLRAEHSPFKPKVSAQLCLADVGRHDQLAVGAHCSDVNRTTRRLR